MAAGSRRGARLAALTIEPVRRPSGEMLSALPTVKACAPAGKEAARSPRRRTAIFFGPTMNLRILAQKQVPSRTVSDRPLIAESFLSCIQGTGASLAAKATPPLVPRSDPRRRSLFAPLVRGRPGTRIHPPRDRGPHRPIRRASGKGLPLVFQERSGCPWGKVVRRFYGAGAGRQFQELSRFSPAFSAETSAVSLRYNAHDYVTSDYDKVEVLPSCDHLLLQVQHLVARSPDRSALTMDSP